MLTLLFLCGVHLICFDYCEQNMRNIFERFVCVAPTIVIKGLSHRCCVVYILRNGSGWYNNSSADSGLPYIVCPSPHYTFHVYQ